MTNQQAEPSASDDADSDRRVTDYLLHHPAFFEQHPEVLIALQVPHLTGGAISLIERQVRVLRKQLETERARLAHLISRAREYEALSLRLHAFVLQLIAIRNPDCLLAALNECLLKEFRADAVTLKLFPLASIHLASARDASPDPLKREFQDFLMRKRALCGPLDSARGVILFGENGAAVRTAAIIPIRADEQSGVLAIGSLDPERFRPDMATDLLDRLGELVSHKLRTLPPRPALATIPPP